MKNFLAIIGGLLATLATVPYILDIVKRKTKPNLVSWATWTLLTAIATAAAFAAHEPRTAILTLGVTIATVLVVLFGLRHGVAKLTWFDGICQLSAIFGLVLWLVIGSPSVAIIFSLGIDFIVMLPTFRHSWRSPQEETWQSFAVGVGASVFTLASLSNYNFISIAFPAYFIFGDLLIVFVIIYRRTQKGLSLAR